MIYQPYIYPTYISPINPHGSPGEISAFSLRFHRGSTARPRGPRSPAAPAAPLGRDLMERLGGLTLRQNLHEATPQQHLDILNIYS